MKFLSDEQAEVKMVGMVIGIFITIIISVLVLYNIAGSIDYDNANQNIAENVYGYGADATDETGINEAWEQYNATTPATNGSDDTLDQAATFFQIAPIIGIVIVAVVILGYVSKIS